ncbi:hypothetical protein Hanom_Chr03g00217631 [Helianthus anomalus]
MTRTTCAHHIKIYNISTHYNIQDLFTFTFRSVTLLHPGFPSNHKIHGEASLLFLRYTSFTRHAISIIST